MGQHHPFASLHIFKAMMTVLLWYKLAWLNEFNVIVPIGSISHLSFALGVSSNPETCKINLNAVNSGKSYYGVKFPPRRYSTDEIDKFITSLNGDRLRLFNQTIESLPSSLIDHLSLTI